MRVWGQTVGHRADDRGDAFLAVGEQIGKFSCHGDGVIARRTDLAQGGVYRHTQPIKALPERAGYLDGTLDSAVAGDVRSLEVGAANVPADDRLSGHAGKAVRRGLREAHLPVRGALLTASHRCAWRK